MTTRRCGRHLSSVCECLLDTRSAAPFCARGGRLSAPESQERRRSFAPHQVRTHPILYVRNSQLAVISFDMVPRWRRITFARFVSAPPRRLFIGHAHRAALRHRMRAGLTVDATLHPPPSSLLAPGFGARHGLFSCSPVLPRCSGGSRLATRGRGPGSLARARELLLRRSDTPAQRPYGTEG